MYSFSIVAVTNYHKFSGLKTTQICSFTLLWIRSLSRLGWFLCTGFHEAKIKGSASLTSCLEALCSFRLLAEFSACGCRTEVPVSFLTASWEPLLALKGHLPPFSHPLLPSSNQQPCVSHSFTL